MLSVADVLALVRWWIVLEVAGFAALPLAAVLFERLEFHGYPLAKTLGVLLLGMGMWMLCMLHLTSFEAGTGALVLVLVAGAGIAALGVGRLRDKLQRLRQHFASALGYEILFLGLFLLGIWLRLHGATGGAILGTEKPMELAFLTGASSSPTFPPLDPWLSGFAINYYYLGYVIVAGLAKLSGVGVSVAFNLGGATVFALAGLTLAALACAMVGSAHLKGGRGPGRLETVLVAGVAIAFVLLVGNQMGALEEILGGPQAVALDGPEVFQALQQKLLGSPVISLPAPVVTSDGDFGTFAQIAPKPGSGFDWWWPSRAVWDETAEPEGSVVRGYDITEFPFFSFYLGDLHPHVLALPFALLALAMSLAVLCEGPTRKERLGRKEVWQLGLAGAVLGSLYAINSWDAPTYALLFVGALAISFRKEDGSGKPGFSWRPFLSATVIVALSAVLSILPFLTTFRTLLGPLPGLTGWEAWPGVRTLLSVFAPSPDHTTLYEFLAIFALFLVPILAFATVPESSANGWGDGDAAQRFRRVPFYLWALPIIALVLGVLIQFPLLALGVLAILFAYLAWAQSGSALRSFVLWSAAVGGFVIVAADLIYIRDPFEDRMNTVFKFYYQAWIIWGAMAAIAAWSLLRRMALRRLAVAAWVIPTAVLLLGALVYPVAALTQGVPWAAPGVTLDGLAFLKDQNPDEYSAELWIEAHVPSADAVLTAVGSSYQDETARVAAVTGRPTLLGWDGSHERLWRIGSADALAAISEREKDVATIYETTDLAVANQLLDHYGVRYVYVGPVERSLYPGPGLEKFTRGMFLLFQQGSVQIFGPQS
ncbi:MAG: DUF2298 domain-containing protein [Anaerolineales bacterium]|jgi:YYY domain-containing protein